MWHSFFCTHVAHSKGLSVSDASSHIGNMQLVVGEEQRCASCILCGRHNMFCLQHIDKGRWGYWLIFHNDCFCTDINMYQDVIAFQLKTGKQLKRQAGKSKKQLLSVNLHPLKKESRSVLVLCPAAVWEHQHAHSLSVTLLDNDPIYSHTSSIPHHTDLDRTVSRVKSKSNDLNICFHTCSLKVFTKSKVRFLTSYFNMWRSPAVDSPFFKMQSFTLIDRSEKES